VLGELSPDSCLWLGVASRPWLDVASRPWLDVASCLSLDVPPSPLISGLGGSNVASESKPRDNGEIEISRSQVLAKLLAELLS